ncbi:MAG: SBBP repeat-containing protein, partial [Polyangiaceae bacterium]
VGICQEGVQFCNASGTDYGPCSGQVVPQPETCFTLEDDDCDGQVNEGGAGCLCVPGSMVPCYSGPAGTAGVGACTQGLALCNNEGTGIGGCEGEVLPTTETCLTAADDDCDGLTNEEGVGCSCTPGATLPCYSGPAGTEGVGACQAGTQTCLPDGSGYGMCTGEVLPSIENCQTAANEDCGQGPDCGGALWSVAFGAAADQQVNAIARDGQGNALLTGRFAGSFIAAGSTLTSAGGYDVLVMKLDPDGNTLWARRFGDAAIYQEGFDIAADAQGNILVTGYFEGTLPFGATVLTSAGATDAFLAKLDPNGGVLWAKRFGGPQAQYGQSVAADPQGNIALLADGFGSMDFGGGPLTSAGNYDLYVARFDPSGAPLWSKRFGGANADVGQSLTVDTAGNILFTGKSDTALDFGGGALPAAGGLDALVVKLDPLGSFIWNKRYGDGGNQFGADIATDVQNDVYLTGGFEGTVHLGGGTLTAVGAVDVFLGKLTSAGAHIWSKRYGAPGANPSIVALAPSPFGGLFFAGTSDGVVDFGGGALPAGGGVDAFAVRLDASGAHAWSKRYGAAGNQYASGAAADGLGRLLLTGYFEQGIDFGTGPLTSAGGLDFFVAKLVP